MFCFFFPFLVLFAVAEHLPCSSQDRNLDLSACLHTVDVISGREEVSNNVLRFDSVRFRLTLHSIS